MVSARTFGALWTVIEELMGELERREVLEEGEEEGVMDRRWIGELNAWATKGTSLMDRR